MASLLLALALGQSEPALEALEMALTCSPDRDDLEDALRLLERLPAEIAARARARLEAARSPR